MNEKNYSQLQKTISTLIANEYLSWQFYTLFGISNLSDINIRNEFNNFANESISSHMRPLIDWCTQNGFKIPCTDAEMHKSASAFAKRSLSETKRFTNPDEYIKAAQKFENLIASEYKNVLDTDDIIQFTDLQSMLWNAYYDKEQRLDKLNSLLIAWNANACLEFGF